MPPQPQPPADLGGRQPLLDELPAGTILHRIHTAIGPNGGRYGPVFFDRSDAGRLNAPDGSYGVLYTAGTREGAFAETFLRAGEDLLSSVLVRRKAYAALRLTRPLTLIQFYGRGLGVLRATSEVTSGPLPYDLPQSWSKALHDAFPDIDGIAYKARHQNQETCYAIFERAADAVEVDSQADDLLALDWLYDLMDVYYLVLS